MRKVTIRRLNSAGKTTGPARLSFTALAPLR